MRYVVTNFRGFIFSKTALLMALALSLPGCLSKEGASSVAGGGGVSHGDGDNEITGPGPESAPSGGDSSSSVTVVQPPQSQAPSDPAVVAAQAVAAANTLNSDPNYQLSSEDVTELQEAEALSSGDAATLAPLIHQ